MQLKPLQHFSREGLKELRVLSGGGGGIRTPEGLAPLTVFKTAAFNRSATPPCSYPLKYPSIDKGRRWASEYLWNNTTTPCVFIVSTVCLNRYEARLLDRLLLHLWYARLNECYPSVCSTKSAASSPASSVLPWIQTGL
jgi:hypothetical protein